MLYRPLNCIQHAVSARQHTFLDLIIIWFQFVDSVLFGQVRWVVFWVLSNIFPAKMVQPLPGEIGLCPCEFCHFIFDSGGVQLCRESVWCYSYEVHLIFRILFTPCPEKRAYGFLCIT